MKKYPLIVLGLLAAVIWAPQLASQVRYRTPINLPDILGYRTLKCDLHIHTVFSDGAVWPDIRSEEAWREGLDAIAITDHIEYQPHAKDLPTRHNRSFEIAKPHGDLLNLTVLKGSEVTRKMPPGHLNAVFLTDSEALDQDDWRVSVRKAREQGAFIFWNHPGWAGQQPDGVARWYPEHTELLEGDMLHGIEVANSREYYPEAHRWCLEKNLTMLSNSDVHMPLNLDYHVHEGDHRPMTLIFAEDSSAEAIRRALFDRRTVVYTGNLLIGKEKYLKPLFAGSISVTTPRLTVRGDGTSYVQIRNASDIDFILKGASEFEEIRVPLEVTLKAGSTSLLAVRGTREDRSGSKTFQLPYTVDNLKVAPDEGMPVELEISITFEPEE